MTKIKTTILLLLAVALIAFITVGATLGAHAYADAVPVTAEESTENTDVTDGLAEQFIGILKDKYGEDYGYYYNLIIEQWGSVEEYLLSLGDKLPEEQRSAWQSFVVWLGEYAPIWATALAVILVIIVVLVGKKQFNNIVDRIVNSKLSPVVKELNLQSGAIAASLQAQKALLGNGERFADTVKKLENSEKELKNG